MRLGRTLILLCAAVLGIGSLALAQSRVAEPTATTTAPRPASESSAMPATSAAPSPAPGESVGIAGSATNSPGVTPGQTSTVPPPAGVDGSTYLVRLRDLEQRIDELKEQIRRSHTRLSLLSETVLAGGAGGARADVVFINDLSGTFRVTQALFVLDGAVQYNKQDDTGLLASQKEIPIFSGSIPPGDHTLQILLKLRGHGYGVFSYLRSYQFEVRNSHSFTVTEGKTVELKAVAFEQGDVTTAIEQRPAVRYVQKIKAGTSGSEAEGREGVGLSSSGSSGKASVGVGSE